MTKINLLALLLLTLLIWAGACLSPNESKDRGELLVAEAELPETIDFNFHIKPILSDRCFKCHGPDANSREADLAFHDEAMAFSAIGKNKDRFAIVPGNPEQSELIKRIFTQDPDDVMPPPESNLTLSLREKNLLKKWVEQGAEWKKHWAFIAPQKVAVPKVENIAWVENEIDHFILEQLDRKGLVPSAAASKEKLIRRLSFDLTGLPPTLEEIDAFINDQNKGAFEKVVNRLLNSRAYGERMAIDWMDLARYADTHGYQNDFERVMWPWRDWVIHAFNSNMPYDQFVKWQLAGDLFENPSKVQILATAFNRNHKITYEGGVIDEEYRVEYVADRAQTFSTAFLGMTMECARCHDHKYDPLSQENYYQLFSFFNNVPEKGLVDEGKIPKPYIEITQKEIDATLTFINNLDTLPSINLMVMEDKKGLRETHILNRGLYDQPTKKVSPETPAAILPFDEFEKNRLGLADWLFDPKNPLTARVAVNRLWQQLFGTGIVASSYDFGNQGSLPSHPELLDFLALKFMESNWDIKALLKYMVSSATYQQSAIATSKSLQIDPENRWISHAPRIRLKSEMIRDQVLHVSGLLQDVVGGPSVKPYQPKGLWQETTGGGGGSTAKYVEDSGNKLFRKSLYTFWKRTVPPPNMMTLDATSRDLCTIKRQETNTPLQALVLLNDPQMIEAAKMLALKVLKITTNEKERLTLMFRAASSRIPNDDELTILQNYLKEGWENYNDHPEQAEQYINIGKHPFPTTINAIELAAYTLTANIILNLDEVITRG